MYFFVTKLFSSLGRDFELQDPIPGMQVVCSESDPIQNETPGIKKGLSPRVTPGLLIQQLCPQKVVVKLAYLRSMGTYFCG